jgi:hypothetical protein
MANDAHSAATTVRSRRPAGVLVFAPAPLLTITIERRGEDPDVHLHAGGQGFWLARMIHARCLRPRRTANEQPAPG